EMISRSDRAELISAAAAGVIGYELRVGAVDRAARLDAIEILVGPKADFDRALRAVAKNLVEIVLLEAQRSASTHAGRNLARDRVHELREALAKDRRRLRRAKQPHAAVDVVSDSARRDHAIVGINGGDSADREAVAFVHVRHRDGPAADAGEGGDVDELVERTVAEDGVEHCLVGVDAGRDAHVASIALGNLPEPVVDLRQHPLFHIIYRILISCTIARARRAGYRPRDTSRP